MSGGELEDQGCLGFTKEAGGEVVEGVVPGYDHVWGHSWVQGDLVEACCHVCFGEQDVLGEQGGEGVESFIVGCRVLGGEVGVSGINEKTVSCGFFLE